MIISVWSYSAYNTELSGPGQIYVYGIIIDFIGERDEKSRNLEGKENLLLQKWLDLIRISP